MWKSENNLWDLVLPLHTVGPGSKLRLPVCNKYVCLLSSLLPSVSKSSHTSKATLLTQWGMGGGVLVWLIYYWVIGHTHRRF